jgi:hypothetical protein
VVSHFENVSEVEYVGRALTNINDSHDDVRIRTVTNFSFECWHHHIFTHHFRSRYLKGKILYWGVEV